MGTFVVDDGFTGISRTVLAGVLVIGTGIGTVARSTVVEIAGATLVVDGMLMFGIRLIS